MSDLGKYILTPTFIIFAACCYYYHFYCSSFFIYTYTYMAQNHSVTSFIKSCMTRSKGNINCEHIFHQKDILQYQ